MNMRYPLFRRPMVRKKLTEEKVDAVFAMFNAWKDIAYIANELDVSKELVRARIRAVYSSTYRRKY